MNTNGATPKDTISGKAIPEVRNNLLGNIVRIKSRLRDQYSDLADRSSLDHVRMLLKSLSENENVDILDLEDAIRNGRFTIDENEDEQEDQRDHALVDHLVNEEEEIDQNDMASVIKGALKISIDMISLLSLMKEEYRAKKLKKTLEILIDRERKNKGSLEELYEEHISKDYW